MKRMSLIAAALCLSFSTPVFAAESDNATSCKMYSKIAGTMVDFMLPLTMQDFVNMMNGKDPKLLGQMTSGLLSGLDAEDVSTMISLGSDAEIAGQAAGDVAMRMLMSGQATSSSQVQRAMKSNCEEIGFDQIIANQKRANRATAGNFSE